jgi:hypothetical protein
LSLSHVVRIVDKGNPQCLARRGESLPFG